MFETVAAISTPRGKGGIATVRISGGDTAEILSRVFRSKGKNPAENPRYAAYGEITDNSEIIDTGIAVFYSEGHSFTGEDSAEISCHGGIAVTKAVLEAVIKAGAVAASAGEFTKRAFINGRLSLTEAEAVGKLIDADTDTRRRLASNAARGALREKTEGIRKKLLGVLSALYAAIDYPDEDVGDEGERSMEAVFTSVSEELAGLLKTYKTGAAISEGVVTVICGAANCGKSSLYNLLCGKEKAIVTDIAGTTRDTLWETVDADGITLRLADTAGIRKTEDKVEGIGVDRAIKCIDEAELVLAVFDGSRELDFDEKRVIGELKSIAAPKIAIINKSDLGLNFPVSEISSLCEKTVFMSAKNGDGKEELYKACADLFNEDRLSPENDALLWDSRHKITVEKAKSLIDLSLTGLKNGDAIDAVCTLAEGALAEISLLDGREITDEIVSEIFARFCVGK